jgi:hypothetical protein
MFARLSAFASVGLESDGLSAAGLVESVFESAGFELSEADGELVGGGEPDPADGFDPAGVVDPDGELEGDPDWPCPDGEFVG